MTSYPLLHPGLAKTLYDARANELQREAAHQRMAASESSPNRIERFFIKRREGKVTWIDTVLVQRSA